MSTLKSSVLEFSDNNLAALKITVIMWLCSLQSIVMIIQSYLKGKKLIFDLRVIIDLAIFGLLLKILEVYLAYSKELITP
jgi:hypothetical protein